MSFQAKVCTFSFVIFVRFIVWFSYTYSKRTFHIPSNCSKIWQGYEKILISWLPAHFSGNATKFHWGLVWHTLYNSFYHFTNVHNSLRTFAPPYLTYTSCSMTSMRVRESIELSRCWYFPLFSDNASSININEDILQHQGHKVVIKWNGLPSLIGTHTHTHTYHQSI